MYSGQSDYYVNERTTTGWNNDHQRQPHDVLVTIRWPQYEVKQHYINYELIYT